ncbi:MAG: bifunctional glutamate N-acetyltransferase/amino-acid acetyltransferase ArgJ [Acidimicrobiales bacterium]|nr:bifunctional glutamate N-acetyltransferase/amino-acid acetyltransferase ArgJ [Acidimicrobiales bacterium]
MSICEPLGFKASGIASGIKASGDLDLALIATEDRNAVATVGVFTSNEAKAAPVLVSLEHLEKSSNMSCAVILNSGNANAATGPSGRDVSRNTAKLVANELGVKTHEVLVCSTGLIGIPLDIGPIENSVTRLVSELDSTNEASDMAAKAILTTDTIKKVALTRGICESGETYGVAGMAKGAAMLAPSMATMLAVITTDVLLEVDQMQIALKRAVDMSFNSLIVDGCMSTNDTVLLLASGKAGKPKSIEEFESQLCLVTHSLAISMAKDAEGSTVMAKILVKGALNERQAAKAARQVASSVLVRCSLYGRDPYWGRVLAELGAARVGIDQELVSISYGPFEVARNGIALSHDEKGLRDYMTKREIEITADLKLGNCEAEIYTADLTHGYVDENMGTS